MPSSIDFQSAFIYTGLVSISYSSITTKAQISNQTLLLHKRLHLTRDGIYIGLKIQLQFLAIIFHNMSTTNKRIDEVNRILQDLRCTLMSTTADWRPLRWPERRRRKILISDGIQWEASEPDQVSCTPCWHPIEATLLLLELALDYCNSNILLSTFNWGARKEVARNFVSQSENSI